MTILTMMRPNTDRFWQPVVSRRQLALIAIGCLILSSCRSVSQGPTNLGERPSPISAAHGHSAPTMTANPAAVVADSPMIAPRWSTQPPAIMQASFTRVDEVPAGIIGHACPHCSPGEACAIENVDQWRPPGIAGPWPADEWICDGGDREQSVHIARNWNVGGIDPEDTVIHYDTLDGKTRVQPSNRVCIYAPRFAAVRQVSGLVMSEQHQIPSGVQAPELPQSQELQLAANNVNQPVQTEHNMGVTPVQAFLDRNLAVGLEDVKFLMGIDFPLLPYEDLAVMRLGQFDNSEKARLAEAVLAAKTWTAAEGVQVIIDGQAAFEAAEAEPVSEVIEYHMPEGKPRVRIVKIASKQNALPGDTVHFTLRFDNVGDQPIGNVTILDNLTPRLEYIPDSAKCSVDADFFTVEQDGALILRWELKNPLDVGEGGVVHFECRIR